MLIALAFNSVRLEETSRAACRAKRRAKALRAEAFAPALGRDAPREGSEPLGCSIPMDALEPPPDCGIELSYASVRAVV